MVGKTNRTIERRTAYELRWIDIHKRYSVCAAHDEQGRELGLRRIEANRGADFGQFLRGLGGTSRVAIEACWNWGAVYEVLGGFARSGGSGGG